jgi:transcriptional regulator with XRE-family HTH domain
VWQPVRVRLVDLDPRVGSVCLIRNVDRGRSERRADLRRRGQLARQLVLDEIVQLFAERLRSVRLSRGLTQAELARQAQVTPTYISRLESAGAAPGIDLVARLAGTLGTTTTDLLPVMATPNPLPALKEQARRLLEALLAQGDSETFQQLNPLLALLVEASAKRGSGKPM